MQRINELIYNSRTLPKSLRYKKPSREEIKKAKSVGDLIRLEDIDELKEFFNQKSDYVDYLIFDFKFFNNTYRAADCEAEIFVFDIQENLVPLPKYKTIKQDNWYHIVAVKDDSYYDKGIPVDTSKFAYRDMYYKVVCFWHLKNAKNEIIFTVQATHLVYLCEGKFRSNVYIVTSHDTDYQTLYKGIEGEKNENYDSCVLLSPKSKMNLDNNFKGIKTGRYMWENRTKAISQFATDYIQYSKYNRLQCCISAFCACYSILALPDCRSIITLSELCSIYKKDILTFNLFEALFRNDEKMNEAKIDSFYNKINEFPSWHKKVKLNLKQIDMLHNIIVNEVFKGKSKEITSKITRSNHSDIYELIFKIALLCTFIDNDLNTLRESSMYEVAEFFYTCKKQQQLQERMEELSRNNKEHPALELWQEYLSKKDKMYFVWKMIFLNGFIDIGNNLENYLDEVVECS